MLSDGRFTYSWNAENRLIAVESTAGFLPADKKKLEFTYDYMGRRVIKKVYSWTTDWQLDKTEKYVWDGYCITAVFDGSDTLQKSMLHGEDLSGSLQGAGGVGGLLAVTDHIGAKTYLSCMNGNGDVMAYVDASDGSKVAEYSPSPNVIVKSGPKADELAQVASFSTIPWDRHLNAFIYPFRILKDGRFLSRDPVDERGGNNLYRLTSNDIINKLDYLGLEWIIMREGEPRAKACASSYTDFLSDLARKIGLDPMEALGSQGWLQDDKGGTVDDLLTFSRLRRVGKLTVPNTVHITYGALYDFGFPSAWPNQYYERATTEADDLTEDFAGTAYTITNDADNFGFGTGYHVIDHRAKRIEGTKPKRWYDNFDNWSPKTKTNTFAQMKKWLAEPNIAIWAHFGHGSKSSGLELENELKYSAAKFGKVVHHKLAMGIFWSCYGSRQKWKPNVVSKNGKVLAVKDISEPSWNWYDLTEN